MAIQGIQASAINQSIQGFNPEKFFSTVWKCTQPMLARRARSLTRGDLASADDLLANTALKALLYLRRAPERVQDLQGLLFVVLDHVFLDGIRRRRREERLFDYSVDPDLEDFTESADPAPSASQLLETRQRVAQVGMIYAQLPAEQQKLFQMRFEENQPYEVIARTFAISEPLARKRVELLRRRLRKSLDQD